MKEKTLRGRDDVEKEIMRVAKALSDMPTTTTKKGAAEYYRLARNVHKITRDPKNLSRWDKLREQIIQALNVELTLEFENKKKRGR